MRLGHGGEVDQVTVADVDGGQPILCGGLGKRGQGVPELAGGVREAQRGVGTPEQGAHMVRSTRPGPPGLLDQVVPQGRLLDQGEGGQRVEQIDGHGTLRRIEVQRPADHGGVGKIVRGIFHAHEGDEEAAWGVGGMRRDGERAGDGVLGGGEVAVDDGQGGEVHGRRLSQKVELLYFT